MCSRMDVFPNGSVPEWICSRMEHTSSDTEVMCGNAYCLSRRLGEKKKKRGTRDWEQRNLDQEKTSVCLNGLTRRIEMRSIVKALR